MRTRLLIALIALFAAAPVAGQTILSTVSGNYRVVTTADFNGDGHLDVAAGLQLGASLHATYGAGDGSFSPLFGITSGGNLHTLSTADVDGDGWIDLLGTTPDFARVMLNDGDGTFAPPLALFVHEAEDVAAGDLDGDGVIDLVVTEGGPFLASSETLSVFHGTGGGAFDPAVSVTVGIRQGDVRLADADQDGDLDAFVNTDSWVTLLTNTEGDLAPTSLIEMIWVDTLINTSQPRPVDLDLDGVVDLVAGSGGNFTLGVFEGLGGGAFGDAVIHPLSHQWDVTVGDVTGDGLPDVVSSSTTTDTLMVFTGLGDGRLAASAPILPGPAGSLFDLALGDYDEDGKDDIAYALGDVTMLPGQASGPPGWTDLGQPLAGTHGEPASLPTHLLPGEGSSIRVAGAVPDTIAWLVLGFEAAEIPLKGGVLVPLPTVITDPLEVDETGSVSVFGVVPDTLPAGLELFLQFWIVDPGGPFGFSATNAWSGHVP